MRRAKTTNESGSKRTIRPALTPEARENQLIELAMDLVEKRILEGTASSQETTHFLKLGSQKARLEKEALEKQIELMEAKKNNLAAAAQMGEMYEEAIKSMRRYSRPGRRRCLGHTQSYADILPLRNVMSTLGSMVKSERTHLGLTVT